ncbi:MAG TPA: ECF transporter S component [Lachnospiraceae bacterium]|nr:ECF transporter S component [Lachnospiraceae bacterium]
MSIGRSNIPLHRVLSEEKKPSAQMYCFCLGILVACEFVLAFSFFGYINFPHISVTTLHIVVLIAALYLGKTAGAAVGAAFGLSSMWKASVLPFVTANAAFSPFISPNPWGSIVTSIFTRVAFGFFAGLIFEFLKKHLPDWCAVISGTLLATFLHSLLVYTSMWFFFPDFGITPFNAVQSLIKINAVITYGLALLVVCGLNLFLRSTKTGRKFMDNYHSGKENPFFIGKIKWIGIFSAVSFVIAISLVMYFISDTTRVFTYYKIALTPETQTLIANMGMQFACGTLSAYLIIILIFVHVYGIIGEAREKAQMSKIAFFTNISHDMRTPLNGIIGCTDLALETDDIEEKDKYLGDVRVSGRVMLDLVNDVLDISKMENGMLKLNLQPYSVKTLIENVEKPIEAAAKSRNVNFDTYTENAPKGYVLIDHVNVQKIILNLLSNAVKFTPEGGHVIFRMELMKEPEEGNNCRITVKDTGIGISPDFLAHIYEPFAQDKNIVAEKQGTGLGLSIVDRLVRMMKGKISVRSTLGEGTEFTVLLPFEAAEKRTGEDEISSGKDSSGNLAGRKILLCEDNDINAMIVKTILEKEGAAVVRAVNGADGAAAFAESAEGKFSAVLMDIRMPVMDGITATEEIRKLKRSDAGRVPVFALSAAVYEDDIQKCMAAGMSGFIGKPVERNELLSKLKSIPGTSLHTSV